MWLIPRFTTEVGRLVESKALGGYDVVPASEVIDGVKYPYSCKIKSFTWFGFYYDYAVTDVESI